MNPAIVILTNEHELIMTVVNALGAMSSELAHRGSVSVDKLHEAVRYAGVR